MPTSLESLRRFEVPGSAHFSVGFGGLPRLEISTSLARATIYLQGAHITSFQPTGRGPLLFLSERSFFVPGKAIRGGVPVIFPWFGAHPSQPSLPQHGFARTAEWQVESVRLWPDETCEAVFMLASSEQTLVVWPFDFVLRLRVAVGRKLMMRLEVENWSGETMHFEEALHSYLAVRNCSQASIAGLQGGEYLDKVDSFTRKKEEGVTVRLEGETDRIYLNTRGVATVDDAAGGRRILVTPEQAATTVIWNPGAAKAAALKDMADDEWQRFVCVETANACENTIQLLHGQAHTMMAMLSLED